MGSPHYFQVFKIPVLRGRDFCDSDLANSTPVVVSNEHMAKEYRPKPDPIGQVILIGKGLGPQRRLGARAGCECLFRPQQAGSLTAFTM